MTSAFPDVTEINTIPRESKLLSSLFKRSHIVAFRWVNQPGFPVQYVSPTIVRFGYEIEDFISGRTLFADLIHPDDVEDVTREVHGHIANGPDEYRQTYRFRHGDGHWIWVDDVTWLTRDESGVVTDISGVLLDSMQHERLERELKLKTALSKSEQHAQQAQRRLELLACVFSHSHDGVVITDEDTAVIEVNDRYCQMTGYDRDELIGQMPSMLNSGYYDPSFYESMWAQLDAQGHWAGEIWNRKKSGTPYPAAIRITALKNSNSSVSNYIAHISDITERLNYEQKLRHVAFYDPLTGLPNRSSLSNNLSQAIARFKYRHIPFAVLFIDLDEFKTINDSNGHEIGDRYLKGVAQRLQSIIREDDTAARFGGDEFVLILQNQQPGSPNHAVFERLLGAMHAPIIVDDKALKLAASFGVTFYPQNNDVDADQLLRQADQAMYSAKQRGKNQIVYFDTEFERSIMVRNSRISELNRAIKNDEMCLHYQPQVDMSTGKVLGVEALVRWNHPVAGLMAPATFLDLTREHEQLGLFLSRWVLAQALDDLARLHARKPDLTLSINTFIPAQARLRSTLLNDLRDTLERHSEISPRLLTLEMVEHTLIDDLSEAIHTIQQIQALGVRISLDDFGTGFSSLSHLKHLSFDELKIDQTFVRDMLSDRDDMTIVQAVVSLSQSFDVSVIAEGVETDRHADILLRLGCTKAQGFAIAHPLPIAELESWLEQWQPNPAWQSITPISPHFYQLIASLSAYTGWLAALDQYLQGKISDIPDRDFRTRTLTAPMQSSVKTQDLWQQARTYVHTLYESGCAAIHAFQRADGQHTDESKRHYQDAASALEKLQTLVWTQLAEPVQ